MSELELLRAELIVAQEELKESRAKVEMLEDQIDVIKEEEEKN